jgi:hypothetical protein
MAAIEVTIVETDDKGKSAVKKRVTTIDALDFDTFADGENFTARWRRGQHSYTVTFEKKFVEQSGPLHPTLPPPK